MDIWRTGSILEARTNYSKGEVMKKVRSVNLLLAAVALSVVGVGAPLAGASTAHNASAHAKTKTLAFSGLYKGNVKILFASSGATGVMSGAGKGTTLGQGTLSATGSTITFSTSGQTDPVKGTATLKGPGGTITIVSTSALASTTSSAAPTTATPDPVTVFGHAKVTKGTGKFAGATGTLTITATFQVTSTTGSETQKFSASLKGSLKIKA